MLESSVWQLSFRVSFHGGSASCAIMCPGLRSPCTPRTPLRRSSTTSARSHGRVGRRVGPVAQRGDASRVLVGERLTLTGVLHQPGRHLELLDTAQRRVPVPVTKVPPVCADEVCVLLGCLQAEAPMPRTAQTARPGTKATRPERKLPIPASVTTVCGASEKRPLQNSRT